MSNVEENKEKPVGGFRSTMGPEPKVIYPVKVPYCGNCSLPIEVNTTLLYATLPIILACFEENVLKCS